MNPAIFLSPFSPEFLVSREAGSNFRPTPLWLAHLIHAPRPHAIFYLLVVVPTTISLALLAEMNGSARSTRLHTGRHRVRCCFFCNNNNNAVVALTSHTTCVPFAFLVPLAHFSPPLRRSGLAPRAEGRRLEYGKILSTIMMILHIMYIMILHIILYHNT